MSMEKEITPTQSATSGEASAEQLKAAAEQPAERRSPLSAWLSLALAVIAWLALMLTNGYAAIAIGCVAAIVAIWGIVANRHGLRKIAITALIAALVLVIVLAAFLAVITFVIG